ncbi:hypothetical protein RBH76_14050 [Oscillospiraceae bacterium MB24-C1]|nr:hypothetical protein RBH76_14050 [Oscillospiraceae bacterium MB24-C1]
MQILKVDSENSGVGVRQFKLLFQFGGASLRGFEFSGYRGVLRFCFLSFFSRVACFFFSWAIAFSVSVLAVPLLF